MAYLHCHTKGCGWSQDDFWEKEGYTPFRDDIISHLKECLFKDKIYGDQYMFIERNIPYKIDESGKAYCSGIEYVSYSLEAKAKIIRNMNVKTHEEWKNKKFSWKCPRCGKNNPDID